MNITVLDGHTLNPGDLSWSELEKLGSCNIYPRCTADEITDQAKEADIILTNKTPLSSETIAQLPKLKYIGVLATGYNVVDIEAAAKHSIPVTNIPTYGSDSVAQAALTHILNLAGRFCHHTDSVRNGGWSARKDWCYWDFQMMELNGKTLGIIGYGRIGRRLAKLARTLGMNVLFTTPRWHELDAWATGTDLQQLLRESDFVSMHCPLTNETEKIINAENMALMKRTAFLVNTARGGLIDEQALAEALNQGIIAGAGLDVLSQEPPPADHPLLKARNCYITPHQAWGTLEARQRLMNQAVENVRAFLEGKPVNVVNGI